MAPRRMSWFDSSEYDSEDEVSIDHDDCRGYNYMDTRVRNYTTDHPRFKFAFDEVNVFAYPSTGGRISASVTAAEIAWLGLSPLSPNSTKAVDQSEEDAFALRVLHLGGQWWPNEVFRDRAILFRYPFPLGRNYPQDLDVGHQLDGGVLILETSPGFVYHQPGRERPEYKPRGYLRLASCATMEERCAVLRDFNATFYPSLEACPNGTIPQTLAEGIARGRNYTELLMNLQDEEYRSTHEWRSTRQEPDHKAEPSLWSSLLVFSGMA